MIKQIQKRDGRLVSFDKHKIKVAIGKAFETSKEKKSKKTVTFLTDKVVSVLETENNDNINVEHIQDIVEQTLMTNGFIKTAKEYIIYRFQRNQIREQNSPLISTYKNITFSSAKDSDIKRENANIDGDTAMGTMLKYGSEGSKQFYQMFMIKPEHAQAHINGDIHIHDMDFAPMGTTTCTQIDLIKLFDGGFSTGHGTLREPNDIASYAALACIAIQSNQNDQHGGQAIVNFDYSMALGVRKTFKKLYLKNLAKSLILLVDNTILEKDIKNNAQKIEKDKNLVPELELKKCEPYFEEEKAFLMNYCNDKEKIRQCQRFAHQQAVKETDRATYQAMESLIHNLNTMHSRAGAQTPFSSINYGMDTSPEGRLVMKNILLATEAGLGNGETPIFPIQIFRVKEGVNYNPEDVNYDLFKLAIRCSAKRLFPNFSFVDAPFNLQYYKEGRPETEIAYMGCVAKESVVTYRINEIIYVESIERMFFRVKELLNKEPFIKGKTEYFDLTNEELNIEIYDSNVSGFVKVKTVLRNLDVYGWKKVVYSNGRILVATNDHPLPIDGLGRTYVQDIPLGSYAPITVQQPINLNSNSFFNKEEAWLAGVILCDAGLAGGAVDIYVGMDEYDIAQKCNELLPNSTIIENHRDEKGNYLTIHCGSVAMSNKYISLFEGGIKQKRRIPHEIFNSSYEIRLAFLAGLMDADGYINKKASKKGIGLRAQIGSVNKELALQEMCLIQSLGFNAKLYETHYDNKNKNKTVYRVEFGASKDLLIAMTCEKKKKGLIWSNTYPMSPLMSTLSQISDIKDADYMNGEMSYDVETESDRFDVNGINSHNCRTRVIGNVVDPEREICNGRGNLSFTSINLPRLAIESKGDIDLFFKKLDNMVNLCIDQLLERFEQQCKKKVKNAPFLMGQGVWIDSDNLDWEDEVREVLKHGTLSIGFIGLAETLKSLIGKHHGESEEAQKLGLKIVGHLRERMDEESQKRKLNFTLLATPAEGLSGRFVNIDKKRYGIIEGITDRDYYTNSFHVPVYYPISAYDKIAIEAPYHALTNAGHISYIEMDGDPTENLDAFERVIRCMKEKGIGYGSVNHPVDRDPVCGFSGIIGDQCPGCGRHENDGVPFDRIRRITGYLVGTLDRFNNAKRAEEHDRVKHSA